jgi:hypothetical protein
MIETHLGFLREIRDSLGGSSTPVPTIDGIQIPAHDYISLGYTNGNTTSVTYKSGGASGTTVATLALAYDGGGNLTSVTRT